VAGDEVEGEIALVQSTVPFVPTACSNPSRLVKNTDDPMMSGEDATEPSTWKNHRRDPSVAFRASRPYGLLNV